MSAGLAKLVEMLNREFTKPSIPAGVVHAELKEDGTATIQIGRRDVHIDADFKILGAGTMVGRKWYDSGLCKREDCEPAEIVIPGPFVGSGEDPS